MGVEHHHHVVHPLREALGEPPPGGDLHGPGHPVQSGAMTGDQRGDAADTGHHVVREGDRTPRQHLVQDPDRAVVQRGITPDQERAGLVVAQLLDDHLLINTGTGAAPVPDGR